MTRRSDPQWLMYAEKEEIERRAFHSFAKLVVYAVLTGLFVALVIYQTKWGF